MDSNPNMIEDIENNERKKGRRKQSAIAVKIAEVQQLRRTRTIYCNTDDETKGLKSVERDNMAHSKTSFGMGRIPQGLGFRSYLGEYRLFRKLGAVNLSLDVWKTLAAKRRLHIHWSSYANDHSVELYISKLRKLPKSHISLWVYQA